MTSKLGVSVYSGKFLSIGIIITSIVEENFTFDIS